MCISTNELSTPRQVAGRWFERSKRHDIMGESLSKPYLGLPYSGCCVYHIHVAMHVYMCHCICMYVCVHGWMDGWMDGCMHACVHVCMHVCMTHIHMCVCMYVSYILQNAYVPALPFLH